MSRKERGERGSVMSMMSRKCDEQRVESVSVMSRKCDECEDEGRGKGPVLNMHT